VYVRADSEAALQQHMVDLSGVLDAVHLSVMDPREELFPLDLYTRFLPFNFNPALDKKDHFRSSYLYADDIARLMPLYGRSQGDGQHPLHILYNRGGEAFIFDHLHRDFKMANSHMAIAGTTGAGKSVMLNGLCLSLSAVHNPRIVAMEVGGSFELSAQYLANYGRDVRVMAFDRKQPIAVNPYAESAKALARIEQEETMLAKRMTTRKPPVYPPGIEEEVLEQQTDKINQLINNRTQPASRQERDCDEDRDILSEMVLATRIMITHGKKKEDDKLDPTDMALITRSLVQAMKYGQQQGVSQIIVSDVMHSMNDLAERETNHDLQARLKQFALRLEHYTVGLRGEFINQPADALDDFDFLHIDFGFMKSESYNDLMDIVCISLLSKILAKAEANKASGRPMQLILDEAHVLFKSDMVAAFVILMAKVARKVGLWLVPCSQNVGDFSGVEARKLLSMMETWMIFSLSADELDKIESFKPLTPEMRSMILDACKYPGLYSEGVLLGARYSGLFRNVPPRIALALAMTEQDERTQRETLQKQHGLTAIQAVEQMAQDLSNPKEAITDERFFHL
jgi:hypothetical protein